MRAPASALARLRRRRARAEVLSFCVTEHELKLLTAADGPRATAREARREIAELTGLVAQLQEQCGDQEREIAQLQDELHGRHEQMRVRARPCFAHLRRR